MRLTEETLNTAGRAGPRDEDKNCKEHSWLTSQTGKIPGEIILLTFTHKPSHFKLLHFNFVGL